MTTYPYTTKDWTQATLPPSPPTPTSITICGSETCYVSKNVPCNLCKDKDKLIVDLQRQISQLRFHMNRRVKR